jgi:hypothetical protein
MKIVVFFFFSFFSNATAFAHGLSYAEKQAILEGGYIEYIRLGALHMLTGYDHLLFLFGVIFFLTSLKEIVKFVTAFTLGHSITLVFATMLKINANYYLVDAVIALSVCYKGFDNLDGFRKYLKVKSPDLLSVVFVFGLIHGFGLSTRLQELPLGYSGIIFRILSFNIGVEIGQIVALACMVTLLHGWRKRESFRKFSAAANSGLILAGLLLFMMQMYGFIYGVSPEEFSPNKHIPAKNPKEIPFRMSQGIISSNNPHRLSTDN